MLCRSCAAAGNTKADGKKAAGGAVAKAKPPPAVGKGGGKADKAKAPTGPAKEPPAVLTVSAIQPESLGQATSHTLLGLLHVCWAG